MPVTVREIISGVLYNIERKFGGFPPEFVNALTVSERCMRAGGRETGAHVVKCGLAKPLIEYSSTFSVSDLDGIRIVRDISFEIPLLAGRRNVRYYLHGDMGRKNWEPFINVVRSLEKGKEYSLLPRDWEQYLQGVG